MRWLDKPLSAKAELLLSCIGLGVAAWLLGSQVGMSGFNATGFAVLVASGVLGVVDYLSKRGDR